MNSILIYNENGTKNDQLIFYKAKKKFIFISRNLKIRATDANIAIESAIATTLFLLTENGDTLILENIKHI